MRDYDGPVTYAANWNDGSVGGGYDILPWWDQVDYIGIDAYFPVTDVTNPSLAQMQTSWTNRADQIESWRQTQGLTDKQVIFTEAGLSSYDGSNITPYAFLSDSPNPNAPADEQEQANGYEALLERDERARLVGRRLLVELGHESQHVVSDIVHAAAQARARRIGRVLRRRATAIPRQQLEHRQWQRRYRRELDGRDAQQRVDGRLRSRRGGIVHRHAQHEYSDRWPTARRLEFGHARIK